MGELLKILAALATQAALAAKQREVSEQRLVESFAQTAVRHNEATDKYMKVIADSSAGRDVIEEKLRKEARDEREAYAAQNALEREKNASERENMRLDSKAANATALEISKQSANQLASMTKFIFACNALSSNSVNEKLRNDVLAGLVSE